MRPLKVTIHVDGGSRGNPGPAAAAAVATDADGLPLAEDSRYLGVATNNVAEYEAVLLALELARQLMATDVEIVNDSELVARQIGGQYRVKQEHLKPLHRQVMETLRGFDRWQVRSVRREHNVRADELVNETLDAAR
ncbi:MAG TPA: ribonuclease HI family protein [Thermoleophilaceae bacterium]